MFKALSGFSRVMLLAACTSGQAHASSVEHKVRSQYNEIEKDKSLVSSSYEVLCESDIMGAHVEVFKKDQAVRKAHVKVFFPGEGGSDSYSFYYEQEKLIFALFSRLSYQTLDQDPQMKQTDTRYYFENGKAILCLKKFAIGKSKDLAGELKKAANTADDCSQADKVHKVAQATIVVSPDPEKLKTAIFGTCPDAASPPPRP